jgi:CCR4-NOT transcription complex subunit 1
MTDEVVQIYDKLCREIEQHLHAIIATPSNPQMAALSSLLEAVLMARHDRDMVTAVPLLQKAIEGLLEGLTSMSSDPELMLRYRDCHLLVLRRLQDPRAHGQQWVNKQVTR